MSKLLLYPVFSIIPSSQLADVDENIDNWLKNNNTHSIRTFLRRSRQKWAHRGYRWVECDDFLETVINRQTVNGYDLRCTFTRFAGVHNHRGMSPLSFYQRDISLGVEYFDNCHQYVNDSQLIRWLKTMKHILLQ